MHDARLVWVTPDAERVIAYCARVSNPANQNNHATEARLLRYCIDHKHWSILEMASMCLEINTTRAIAPQVLRHRSFSFQEFCLAGSSVITIQSENGIVQRIPIQELFRKWKSSRFKARYARSYDTELERFIEAPILDVYKSGLKPVYEFSIQAPQSIKTIRCTREHKVLTQERGFVPFGEAFDEGLTVALNGVDAEPLPYQRKEVLEANAWKGSERFAQEMGIASVTARKWFRKHGIKPGKPNNYAASSIDVQFSARLTSFMKWARSHVRSAACSKCGHDGSASRLELSHIVAHDGDPRLAFDPDNLQTLCSTCHREHDIKTQGKSYGWTLGMTAKWGRIQSQTYLGIEETYDIEMDHPTHNFVADGVVVHNSLRYAEAIDEPVMPDLRLQDHTNRQNSLPMEDSVASDRLYRDISLHLHESTALYDRLLRSGIAREVARDVLPLATPTRLYMSGTIRSWIHYTQLRCGNGTQVEHQRIAESARRILFEQLPTIAEALQP